MLHTSNGCVMHLYLVAYFKFNIYSTIAYTLPLPLQYTLYLNCVGFKFPFVRFELLRIPEDMAGKWLC